MITVDIERVLAGIRDTKVRKAIDDKCEVAEIIEEIDD